MTWEQAVRWCMAEPSMSDLARDAYFDDPAVAARRYHSSAEFAAIRLVLPKERGRALDLGAGNGILSFALAAEGWAVTAIEPDSSDLIGAGAIRATSADTGMPIEVIEAFGEDIPLEAAGFDLVVARQVLHHASDLSAFCREMSRLVRPGGLVLTLRDHVISGPKQRGAFLAGHPLHHLYGGENAFTLAEYRDALVSSGLCIMQEWRSFQSVINYDPMTELQFLDRLASRAGPMAGMLRPVMGVVPFKAITAIATAMDRRPGRLVSFLSRKSGE